MPGDPDSFEVEIDTTLEDGIRLGEAETLVEAWSLIETVQDSKYQPTAYHIRPKEDA